MSEAELVEEAIQLARTIAIEGRSTAGRRDRRRGRRLARLIADPDGLAMAIGLTDEVLRQRDHKRAARVFVDVVQGRAGVPAALPVIDALGLRVAATLAPLAPGLIMPLVRARLRGETRTLILPADARWLSRHIRRRRDQGIAMNINLLGEVVLGEREALLRLAAVRELLRRPEVDYISVKLSSISSRLSALAFDETVEELTERLSPVFGDAARLKKFVNLDMEEYRDLWLTTAVFRRLLDRHPDLEAGIVLQAYLPDAHAALVEILPLGPRVKVRLVKGANLAMERVDAEIHGWPLAPYDTKEDVDASFKRLLDIAMQHGDVRIGVASHNLFDVAWALTLARHRGAQARIDIEMLEGMAPAQARAVARRAPLRLYAPIVPASEFDAAIAYLTRRLEENSQQGNFLRHVFDLDPASRAWADQEAKFRESIARRHALDVSARRTQDRTVPHAEAEASPGAGEPRSTVDVGPGCVFHNEPDTDFTLRANRRWIAASLKEPFPTDIGEGEPQDGFDPSTGEVLYTWHAATPETARRALAVANAASEQWRRTSTRERASVLLRVAEELVKARGELIAAMVRDAGKAIAEADSEVSEAIDFARYYATHARDLDRVQRDGVAFEPYRVTVVVPPWNFPVAIPTGGVLAALVTGSAAILKPAPETVLCGALVANVVSRAGIPPGVFQFVPCMDDDAGRVLVSGADGVILTGSAQTARLFHSWNPRMRLHAETSGKNAIVVTASADLDAATKDIVQSAFGHAGQKCSAASLAICESAVYDDPRFRQKLADAAQSIVVGEASAPRTQMGPLILPPTGALARALQRLDPGESWLVAPEQLDAAGRLWSPGIRLGVAPGSWFHVTECFGPVLGVMRAPDLDTAIEWQNATPFGLTAGIHSLDRREVARWLDRVQAGNCYINRPVTGAIVGRQPFGGWKASTVGPTAKAGGPNYLLTLGRWRDARRTVSHSDEPFRAWIQHFESESDASRLVAERNALRYVPMDRVALRLGPCASNGDLDLARAAAELAQTEIVTSLHRDEDDDAFAMRLPELGVGRLRVVGGASDVLLRAAHAAEITVDDSPVVAHGRIELLRWLREQAVTETLHRYGNPRR